MNICKHWIYIQVRRYLVSGSCVELINVYLYLWCTAYVFNNWGYLCCLGGHRQRSKGESSFLWHSWIGDFFGFLHRNCVDDMNI